MCGKKLNEMAYLCLRFPKHFDHVFVILLFQEK
jgi:hypothetical protein